MAKPDFKKLLGQALIKRQRCRSSSAPYRLINGAADAFPGIFIDVFDRTLIVQTMGTSVHKIMEPLFNDLEEIIKPEAIFVKDQNDYLARGQIRKDEIEINEDVFHYTYNTKNPVPFPLEDRRIRLILNRFLKSSPQAKVLAVTPNPDFLLSNDHRRTVLEHIPTQAQSLTDVTVALRKLSETDFKCSVAVFDSSFLKRVKEHQKSLFHIFYQILKLLPEGLLLIKTKDWNDMVRVLQSVEKKIPNALFVTQIESAGLDFPDILSQKTTEFVSMSVSASKYES